MKKITASLFVAFSFLTVFQSCEPRKVIVNRQVESQNDGQLLLGTQTKDQFLKEPFSEWYNSEYESYQLNEAAMEELKKEKLNSYQIVSFVGTWCEDSHREFPRLMKILDALKYPESKHLIIAVNRKKESPNGEEGIYNIQLVPTIIVRKYGKEIGRIVEFPTTGFIEKDLLEIIKKDNGEGISTLFKK